MKTATIQQVRNHTAEMFEGSEPILVTRRGAPIGVIQPTPEPSTLPMEVRRKLYRESLAEVRRQLAANGGTAEQVDRDIDALLFKRRRRR